MPIILKYDMTEEDIKLNFITPALIAKGWNDKITMETKVKFTDGKINLQLNWKHSRNWECFLAFKMLHKYLGHSISNNVITLYKKPSIEYKNELMKKLSLIEKVNSAENSW